MYSLVGAELENSLFDLGFDYRRMIRFNHAFKMILCIESHNKGKGSQGWNAFFVSLGKAKEGRNKKMPCLLAQLGIRHCLPQSMGSAAFLTYS